MKAASAAPAKGRRRRASAPDDKAPEAFRTIGEVASQLGLRQHVVRYWEQHFPMLKPVQRSGGRRYYRPEDVALLATIDRLVHREGYTLRGAAQYLKNEGADPAPPVAPQLARLPEEVRAELHAIRALLAGVLSELDA